MKLAAAMEQARSTALRAIQLDPKLAAGHSSLGVVIMYYDFDYAAAERQFVEARAADVSLRADVVRLRSVARISGPHGRGARLHRTRA